MAMIKNVLILIFCFGIGLVSLAQRITGVVIDAKTGEELPGVNLYFKSNTALGTATSLSGEFSLAIEGAQLSDTVVISFIGYRKALYPLSALQQLKVIKLDMVGQKMQEVVVKAERLIAEEFNVKKISQIGIYKNPSANADPLLAVNSLPSATTTDESANVSFRGSSASETGIFFNDVPIYDAVRFAGLSGIGTFSIFNTSIVKDVVVFPGNPPLEYGNTTAGVISIYTNDKIPRKSQNSAVLSLASLGYNRYQRLSEKSGLTFFTNYSPSAAIRSLNQEALSNILKFRSNDVGLNFVHRFDSKTQLSFFNYAISEGYTFILRSPTFEGEFLQRRRRNFSVLNLKRNFSKSSIAFNAGYSIGAISFDYSSTAIDIDNRDYFLGINYQYYGKSDDLKIGLSLDNRKQKFVGTVPEFSYAIGTDHPTIFTESEQTVSVPEVYFYYKNNLSKKWTLGIGTRKNIFHEEGLGYWSYQGNVHYKPTKYLQLIMGAGQYHRSQLGRNEAGAEVFRSRQASIDIKYKRNRLEQSLSFFHKKNKAGNSTKISGVEYYTDVKVGSKTKVQLSLSAIQARTSNGELTYDTPFDINPFIKGSISREFPYGISVTTNFLWREGVPFQPITGATFNSSLNAYEPIMARLDEQERLGSYKRINMSISKLHPINEQLTIIYFASVNNIFDSKNERSLIYNFDYTANNSEYFSRRSVYFGASINF